MANKTLTANVKLNTKSAEQSLTRLTKKIDSVQKAITKTGTNQKLVKAIDKAVQKTNQLTVATNKWASATNKVASTTAKVATTAKKVNSANQQATNSARKLGSAYRSTNANANGLLNTVKRLAATYLGVMGMRATINTSDTITSAENRFNNLEGGNANLTQSSMDKIYAASQRSRSSYGDMLSNVSKSMTLAGDAFQGNVDNAIKFQEIMAKAYTIGGASEAEQASSMYQLVQALGSGVLQGDELRSVREGAPIAYKKMEQFCQSVLKTDRSLKDLASDGVVTSDIIVAAIMSAEKEINDSFNNTQMTFAQAWNNIKNTATKAFEPVLKRLNKMLNGDLGKRALAGITKALVVAAQAADWLLTAFEAIAEWCITNWEWIKYVIAGVFATMAIMAVQSAAQVITAFLSANWQILLIVASVMAILYVYELWRQGTIDLTDAIIYCLAIIAAALVVAGIILGNVPMLIAAMVVGILAIIFMFFSEICGGVNVAVQAVVNAFFWCGNLIMAIWEWIKAVAYNAMAGIVNIAMALANSFVAICENIGTAFENAWIFAQNAFWDFVQSVLEGVKWLEPAINAIAQAFGKDGFTLTGLIENVESKKKSYKEFTSVGDAWNSGMGTMEYKNLTEAWNTGWNTYDAFEQGWAGDAYDAGYTWGTGIEDAINEWGSQFQGSSEDGLFSDIGSMLGIDLNGLLNGLVDPNDPSYSTSGSYDPSGANQDILDALDRIGDNTELSQEDLDYLRRVADMEWKKEFTTASITIDMSNYNTINGDGDLDGIVTKLTDKLYEEMNAVANGVYA